MNSLERLYIEIQPKLYTFFYLKTGDAATAEDLTQDVFYEAIKSITRFKEESTLKTWLFAIAHNLLKKFYRSSRYEKQLQDRVQGKVTGELPSIEKIVELKEEVASLFRRIQQFNELEKEILLLRLYGELSFKEIGDLIEKSENYVRVTFHRLKIKLQREMGGTNG